MKLAVFSTLRPEDINVARAPGRGVRDFKHFLEYAERGARAMAEAFAPTGHATDSPFEDAVKARLESMGWEVHPQVGVSGFRIDLGVVHPDRPGRYLAGVECDGATYHRAATARDRDRLREMVLRDLGWRIRRVWSTAWWMDADTACERLHAQLTQDLAEERQSAVEQATAVAAREEDHEEGPTDAVTFDDAASKALDITGKDASAPEPSRDMERPQLVARGYTLEPVAPLPPRMLAPYHLTDLLATFTPEPLQFYDTAYRPVLQRMAADVIAREGPIMESVLVHRIARAHGFQRSGPRIQEIIQGVIEDKFRQSREDDRTIYWPEGADHTGFWPLRGPGQEPRSVADIPLAELASRARELLWETEEVDEVVARMAQDLGLGWLRQSTRARLLDAIRLAERSSTIAH
jgi:very-short-patch-repair endonuclease